jgi:mannose-6-phosphate isomerase-like protein (cupin superfamily)
MRTGLGVVTCAVVVYAAAVGEAGCAEKPSPGGYVVERATEIAVSAPGPHNGLGQTTGSTFFRSVPRVPFAFTRRVLHRGSSIGSHEQREDEIYFVVSGTGRMTIDGDSFDVGAGDGVLTRPGSTHGLVQAGDDDLVIIIVYPRR